MDALKSLEPLGLALPTPWYGFGAILFGVIGCLAFRRSKETSRAALTWGGVVLMLYPYAVAQTWLLWVAGVALCGWVYVKWE